MTNFTLRTKVYFQTYGILLFFCSCCTTPAVDLDLLAFALARGSIAKVIASLCTIMDHLDLQYKAASLIDSMESVRINLLYKYGNVHFLLFFNFFLYLFMPISINMYITSVHAVTCVLHMHLCALVRLNFI